MLSERSRVYPCRSNNQRKRPPHRFWIGRRPRYARWPSLLRWQYRRWRWWRWAAHIVSRAGQSLSYRHPVFSVPDTVFSWLTSGIKNSGNFHSGKKFWKLSPEPIPIHLQKLPIPIPKIPPLFTLENRRFLTLPITPKTSLNPLHTLPFPEPLALAKCSSLCIGGWGAAAADQLPQCLSKGLCGATTYRGTREGF